MTCGYDVKVEAEPESGGGKKKGMDDARSTKVKKLGGARGGASSIVEEDGCSSPSNASSNGDINVQAISSPSSSSCCSSVSTRPPDSDSEEFELEAKDDTGIISEAITEVAQEANEMGPSAQLGAAFAAVAAEAAAEVAKAAKETEGAGGTTPRQDPQQADLGCFWHSIEVQYQPWANGDFANVGRIAKSVLGEVQYLRDRDGKGVVAKVMPTSAVLQSRSKPENERHAWLYDVEVPTIEDPWNEIAVLTYLQHRSFENCHHIIQLLGMFQDETSTYVVTEYCDGGELFERVAYGDPLTDAESRCYITQILTAVRYLHGHNIGHRDISLENVLLRRGDCILMDFGQAVRLRDADGKDLQYYAEAGKKMYRAPEMYVPRQRSIQVACPMDASPGSVAQVSYDRCRCMVWVPQDATPGRICFAEPYGYAVASADLFACGVCAFVLVVGKPPWSIARDTDPTFSFIRRHGVPSLLRQWRGVLDTAPHEEDHLLAEMLRVDPVLRPSIDECLRNEWLSGLPAKVP